MSVRFRVAAPPSLPAPAAYAAALVAPVLALLAETVGRHWSAPAPFVMFLLATAAVAWVGGIGPALTSAVLSATLGGFLLEGAGVPLRAAPPATALVVFLPAGVLVAVLGAMARAAVLERGAAADAIARSEAIERARAAELEALVEAVPAFVWIARDPRAEQIWSNRAAAALLRTDPGTGTWAMDGSGPRAFTLLQDGSPIPPDDAPVRAAARGEPRRGVELEVAFPDGSRRRILGNAEPIRGEGGAPRGSVAAFVDVSRLAEALEALRQHERELAAALQARDAFLSAASHELKTPLTSLSLHLQGLLRLQRATGELPPDQLSGRLDAMSRQVTRLARLVDELLDVSRIAAGRLHLALEDLDLAAVVREVATRIDADRPPGGPPLQLELADPVRGRSDRIRLEQVATNLLTNAVKYGNGNPVSVSLSAREGSACLQVRDRGIGIPPGEQARIFERFERGAAARNYGGIGLGLWIVREIVGALGGAVEVESAPGAGSTFTVLLPLAGPPGAGRPEGGGEEGDRPDGREERRSA